MLRLRNMPQKLTGNERPEDTLTRVIDVLESAPRMGGETDEPEGARFIQISDTMAKQIVTLLSDVRRRLL